MTHRRKAFSLLLMFGLTAALLTAQTTASTSEFDEGMRLFRDGQYEQAIPHFRVFIQDTAAAASRPEIYLLLAKSAMAAGKLDDAEKSLEYYLATFGGAPDYQEALYQKGRLLYLQEQYEESIQALQSFISASPSSTFASSAWYWVGESLASLGRIDEAERVFQKIVTDYPSSVKVEAAQYRISVIRLQKKEIELARLLKWSHEDFLKSIEEFQRRESTYEQAIEAYQKKMGPLGADQDPRTIADLRAELDKKTAEAARLSAQLAQASSAAGAAPAAATATAPGASDAAQLQRRERMLTIKEQALALKEQYLLLLESGGAAP
ncbi:MAG TPA: tetratricopeptide repeat protein [Spirochaetia bacterium]|nr:tetratricopeptide repeat protein [Spirochaetia bacterium]